MVKYPINVENLLFREQCIDLLTINTILFIIT